MTKNPSDLWNAAPLHQEVACWVGLYKDSLRTRIHWCAGHQRGQEDSRTSSSSGWFSSERFATSKVPLNFRGGRADADDDIHEAVTPQQWLEGRKWNPFKALAAKLGQKPVATPPVCVCV